MNIRPLTASERAAVADMMDTAAKHDEANARASQASRGMLHPTAADRAAVQAQAAHDAKCEAIIKAQHAAEFLACDLQAALKHASALEALAILPLIRQARELRDGIAALESALSATE
jgi:hypothetical protein